MTEKIDFRQIRNFSETISASVVFLRQNFKILWSSLVRVALPVLLIGMIGSAICTSLVYGDLFLFDAITNPTGMEDAGAIPGLQYIGLMYLFIAITLVGGALIMAVMFAYITLYMERADYENIRVEEVRERALKFAWNVIGTLLITSIGFILVYLVAVFGGVIFALIHPAIAVIFAFGVLVGMAYLFTTISPIFIMRIVERKEYFDALPRCFKIIKGYFWSSLGIYIIAMMMSYSISALPSLATQGLSLGIMTFSLPILKIALVVMQVLYSVVYLVSSSFGTLIISMRYFTLVEIHDSIGMRYKIAAIGKN